MKFDNLDPKKDCIVKIDLNNNNDRIPLNIIAILIIIGMFVANIYYPEFSQYAYSEVVTGQIEFEHYVRVK